MQEKPLSSPNPAWCNVTAQSLGLDPAGYAVYFGQATFVETPLPWKRSLYTEAGSMPQEALDLMSLWRQRFQETGAYDQRLLLIAPDEEYSIAGYRWILHFEKPQDSFCCFSRQAYLVPEEKVGSLLWSLYEAREKLPQFEQHREETLASRRDILICTHGTIDVACAKFGYPLYLYLREEFAARDLDNELRVWRVSHFGGHVFAPTMIDMPSGQSWAFVGVEQARQILLRHEPVSDLRRHYRGWAGLKDGFVQAAECVVWQQQGWNWCSCEREGTIQRQDSSAEPQWAEVAIGCRLPDGRNQIYRFRVEVAGVVNTAPNSGPSMPHPYPQYRVLPLAMDTQT